jgi:MSHA biogenesis protein MshM
MPLPLSRSLYNEFFCLRQPPFSLTPHTDFFYAGGNRGATLDALVYAILHTEGVITVTGEVGSGKTMLSRMLIEHKPRHLEIVYLGNPSLAREEVVSVVAEELRVKVKDLRPVQIRRALQKKLIALHMQGKRVLVLIDEAHAVAPATLEEIRLLSNLETSQHKLLRIILVGQHELEHTLATTAMRPLRERITERFHLDPLAAGEVVDYLGYRLRRAGGDPQTFEPRAAIALARASEGLTRRVNILAEKSLLAAYSDGSRQVRVNHVRQAIKDARYRRLTGHWRQLFSPGRWRPALRLAA